MENLFDDILPGGYQSMPRPEKIDCRPSSKATAQYLNEREVSRMTGIALSTLRNDRSRGRGIPFAKVGRSVRYDAGTVVQYMKDCTVQTTR